jgi:putative transposase
MQVVPSSYWRHAAQQANPALQCARVQRNKVLSVEIERV